MNKLNEFTKEEIEQIFSECKSQAAVAKKLGYDHVGGGTQAMLKRQVAENNIDISHFTGQGQNKGNVDLTRFRKGNPISGLRDSLLIIRPHKCECCGNDTWLGKPIPLEAHHIDGDHLNNELENLQLLCPNCHAQTDSWCGRNIKNKGEKKVSDEDLLAALKSSYTIREALIKVGVNYTTQVQYEKARQLMFDNNYEFPKKIKSPNKDGFKTNKKRKKKSTRYCSCCGSPLSIKTKGTLCKECYKYDKSRRKVIRPEREVLMADITEMPFIKIGKKYGVSDKTIVKWCKMYGLPTSRKSLKNDILLDRNL